MKIGSRGLSLIKRFESCRLVAYAATEHERQRGIWTIGYGHTQGVSEVDICTQEQAETWLNEDVAEFEAGVERLVTVPLAQNQFDALVSFAFNVGLDIDEDTKAEGLCCIKTVAPAILWRVLLFSKERLDLTRLVGIRTYKPRY